MLSRKVRETPFPIPDVRWIHGDLTEPMQPSVFEGVDLVYHLAAEIEDPEKMKALQIRGTQNLLEAAKTAGVRRWIQLSSVGVYGPPGAQVIHEQTEPAPIGLYKNQIQS